MSYAGPGRLEMVSLISRPLLRRTVQASPSTSSADNYSTYASLQKITVAHMNAGITKARTTVFGRQEQFPLQATLQATLKPTLQAPLKPTLQGAIFCFFQRHCSVSQQSHSINASVTNILWTSCFHIYKWY